MAEKEAKVDANKRRIRQPPSVPFLWEVRPGIAKKDWNPVPSSVNMTLPRPTPTPIKLIASVPFNWEEKPGTPLHSFSQAPAEPMTVPLSSMLTTLPPAPTKLIASVPFNWEEKPGTPLPSFSQPAVEPTTVSPSEMFMTLPPPPVYSPSYFNGCNNNDEPAVFEMDLEAFGFETDDSSFSSAPSTEISTIVTSQKVYQTDNGSDHLETLSSPASETDSTSSYATGAASLVGASFLECLFPLLSPSSGFLETVRHPEQGSRAQRDFDRESNNTVVIRRPPTLGELIMMSRRRSYQRKAAQIREKNISMEFLKERATGCCIFGTDIIEGLQLKKFQPRLKFF
ncbi:hypothetical protein HRI_004326700 [Hibiscus trionum]|uniref:Hydroxyproline-rich glycoprotein family protein n=1 Tax=Hibiscus trionum TaxID=183268 RepID=A0A9W7J1U4_HIBTR|nr:hypothetical protein HRI_004326700 [Hibiscus trionum]